MKVKDFCNAMLGAGAATLGCILATKGVQALENPTKRAALKRCAKNIKNAITNKAES